MLYRITRHTALTSAHRPRLIESTHTTTILTRRVGIKTTRQTLCTYVGINTYYKNKKAQLRGATPSLLTKITASEVKLVEQIEHLKAEVAVLKRNNAEQLRMIERMLLNANAIPNLDLYALIKKRPEEIQNG
jgi:hypothetical protein